MRLDKYVASAAQCSRTDARKEIAAGRVMVDGVVCKKADAQLAQGAQVALAGAALQHEEYVYLMLDKPEGVVSASRDARDVTVADLVHDAYPRRTLFPAGRLDKTSTGFVLLTDDGAFAHNLLAPKRHVAKTYLVTVDAPLTQDMVEGFAAGVRLADGSVMHPAALRPLEPCVGEVVLTQGVYHQIKRMFGVYGVGVNALRRTAIGGVALDAALGPGGFRPLTPQEKALLASRG